MHSYVMSISQMTGFILRAYQFLVFFI